MGLLLLWLTAYSNEISGALSGLTRVRRFHQDDAHIFCRPSQISSEISSTLEFIDVVYRVFHLPSYKLRLSTRPEKYIGAPDEWDRAELALKEALGASGREWSVNEGDGAFYGPKIDIILKDSDGKEHQTATIQLDFQLPARFELQYLAPAPESERRGTQSHDPKELSEHGLVTPVIIHRAILGSLERFMALLIEHYNGRWPFWLSPRQAIIIPVAATEGILSYARTVRGVLSGIDVQEQEDTMIGVEHDEQRMTTANVDLRESPAKHIRPLPLGRRTFQVDIDTSTNSLSKKIREARTKQYNHVIVVGEKNMGAGSISVQSWVTGMGTQATSMKDGRPGYTDAEEMSAKELYDIFLTMEKRYL